MGIVFGSVPFLLKGTGVSYSELAVFSFAGYPYSLKLLWSPVVDTFYWAGPWPRPRARTADPATPTQHGRVCLCGASHAATARGPPLRSAHGRAGFGRRKSWIVPIQLVSGVLMLWMAQNMESWLQPVRTVPAPAHGLPHHRAQG